MAASQPASSPIGTEDARRLTALLIARTSDAVIDLDNAGRICSWNPAAGRLFGRSETAVREHPFEELLVAGSHEKPVRAGAPSRITCRHADGSTFQAELWVVTHTDAGRTAHTALVHDLGDRVADAALVPAHAQNYRDLVEHLPGVVYRSRIGRWAPLVYASPRLESLLGYRPEEWVGVPGTWEEHIHPLDRERILTTREKATTAGPAAAPLEDREYRMRTRDGREIWVRDHADLERDAEGVPVAWNGYLTDITERKRLESELVQLAFKDQLTGLANRALFHDRVAHAMARNEREPTAVAMLMIDVDDFKRVNDAYGHEVGDRLLVAVADRLKANVRPAATIARIGGDEFAVLLEDLPDHDAALVVAQRVVRSFDNPLRLDGPTVLARVSVGVAVDMTGRRTPAWLMRSADTAMYEAKRMGKGRWRAYDPAAHLASAKRLVLENELRRAVERQQFVLAYQPVTNLRTGEIVGSEALIRWSHPTRGIVPPVDFVPLLEALELIVPVGLWVIREACRQAAAWVHVVPSLEWTSVNVSAAQLGSDGFLASVREAIATAGLDPSRLVLEVTESLALDDDARTRDRLNALREIGVRIAIDDFGTGYSSLAHLRRLPVDKLKIDRAFVDGVGIDAEGAAVAKTIVDLARTLRLTTIAEGIETRQQAEALLAMGCELGQGYLFARPLEPANLAALVVGRLAAIRMSRAAESTGRNGV